MNARELIDFQWPFIEALIASKVDLERSARESGALIRKRGVDSAATLLKLAMMYGFAGFSLRQTAALAAANGLADVSDVALLKRFRHCATWLGELLSGLLQRNAAASLPARDLKLRMIDATTVSGPGSKQTDWRVHLSFDLQRNRIDEVELTTAAGGESLNRFSLRPRDLVVADRGYAHRSAFATVARANAFFIVRINWQNTPLESPSQQPFDTMAALRSLPDAEAAEFDVVVRADGKALKTRLVAIRKTEVATERARKTILRDRSKKVRGLDPTTLEAAGYIYVLTNVPLTELSTNEILEIYRFRWQVELAFKRLKSVIRLDALPAKDPDLARMYLTAKLLGAIVIDDLTERYVSFSPWGYAIEPASVVMACPETIS